MEKLIEILEDIQPDADYETCTTLIDDGILDSFAILSIVGELEDEFDVSVTPADIIPENFNSAQALWAMVQRLQAESENKRGHENDKKYHVDTRKCLTWYFFMFCDNIFLSQIVRPVFGRMIHQKSGKAG